MKMTIGKKLYSALSALLVITLLMGGLAIRNIGELGNSVQDLGNHSATIAFLAGDVNNNTTDMLATSRGILVRGYAKDPDTIRTYLAHYYDDAAKLKSEAEQVIKGTTFVPVQDIEQTQVLDKLGDLNQMNATLADLAIKGDMDQAMTLFKDKIDPLANAISDAGDKAMRVNRQDEQTTAANDIAIVNPARYLSSAMILMSMLVGGACVIVIRSINNTLRENIAELRDGAEQVANAASQVSSSSQSLAQGASEQAASLEETSASSEEINSMARKNTDNSRSTAELLTQSQQKVTLANQYLSDMEVSMNQITESSGKISKIIKVIDEIAFQTNILALNAAVEAARAGEAGMGFAVVADEVRSLAQRSAQAAKDTAVLIEDSIARSSEGRSKVDQVAVAIRAVTEDSARVKVMVDEVSLGSEEQSRGIDQIGRAISQMEQVTQTTAASAEQSAAAAEELSAQSETMKDVVGRLQAMVDTGSGYDSRAAVRIAPIYPARSSRQPQSSAPRPLQSGTRKAAFQAPMFNTQVPAALLDSAKNGHARASDFPMEDNFQSF
jgi:methyl-accepting chemotaxis protein